NNGKMELLEEVKVSNRLADIHYIRQKEPKGLGHAVWTARKFIGNEPFAVLLGDDIMRHEVPCLKQMMNMFDRTQSSVLAVQQVPWEDVSRYGIVKVTQHQGRLHQIEKLVEKPKREDAPSNLAIIGRYILCPTIFDILDHQKIGAGGEIQLTDAIDVLNRTEDVYAYEFEGKRYDVGEVAGFVKTTLDFAMQDPKLRDEILDYIKRTLL
ncbi:MAG: UTP--glucose-1-phosphate uridylyltransferase, partial [Tumebacillaceae bacterium]